MLLNTLLVAAIALIISERPLYGQETNSGVAERDGRAEAAGGIDVGRLIRSAEDLRRASEAMEKFGGSLERASVILGPSIETTSKNMASMTSGFDPLGLQTAFRTIQQQNERISERQEQLERRQNRRIQRLKQKIRRLRKRSDRQASP